MAIFSSSPTTPCGAVPNSLARDLVLGDLDLVNLGLVVLVLVSLVLVGLDLGLVVLVIGLGVELVIWRQDAVQVADLNDLGVSEGVGKVPRRSRPGGGPGVRR